MISIKDLAKECGVSIATVSKALNDLPDVSAVTKEKIREAARKMGYTPNSLARSIKTNRTHLIGVLLSDESGSALNHEYFSLILEAIKSTVESKGYDLAFVNRNTVSSYLQHCSYRGFEGVIVMAVNFNDPQIKELIDSKLPVVTIDYSFNKKTAVLSDNMVGNRKLLEYVYSMGHRNIGFIIGDDTQVTKERIASITSFLEEYDLAIPPENFKHVHFCDNNETYVATKELLSLKDRPTCIFFPDDYSAIGGYNAIYELGLELPDDISVVGYDGIELSRILSPRLVTYYQNTKELGEIAANKLIAQIEDPENSKDETIYVSGELFDGGSVKRIA